MLSYKLDLGGLSKDIQFVAQAEPIFAHLYACYNNVAAKADKMEK